MWTYSKKLEYPINIRNTNPKLAKVIISQYGGPDGELAASLRYLSQRFGMPDQTSKAILNDIGTVELALYLDTHPDDTKALCLHNKYSKELKEICDKYQKVYGPLTIEYPCNKWRWLEEPWPWEGGND